MAVVLQGTPSVYEAASGTTAVVPYPAGVTAGEMLIAAITFSGGTPPSSTPPAGWTLGLNIDGGTAVQTSVWYKIATGSESGSVTWTSGSANGRTTGIMTRWSGVDNTTPLDVASVSAATGGAGNSVTAPSQTLVTAGVTVFTAVSVNASTSTDIATASGWTRDGGSTGTGRRTAIFHKDYASTGATGTTVWAQTVNVASLEMIAISLALRPAAGGTAGDVNAVAATATATAVAPAVSDGSSAGAVTAVTATATATAPAPAVSNGSSAGNVSAVRAQATAAAGVPSVIGATLPVLNRCVQGIPGTTSQSFAINTTSAISVRIKAGTNTGLTAGVQFGAAVTPDGNGNAQVTVTGLTAGTVYFFRVEMQDAASTPFLDAWGTVGEFKTDQNSAMDFSFGFGSCCNATDSASMGAIATKNPDLFFHLGDEYYADASGTTVANFRTKMDAKKTATNHKAVYRTSGAHMVPSDHDGMNNNGNAGSDATAWTNWNQVYREMNPSGNIPATTGVYSSFKRGRIRFIAIDRRSFATVASATDNSSKTCLGATQKQWFKDQITNATEPVIIVQNPDPWIGSAVAGDDGWFGYTTERMELANHIAASGKNVIFLGGDMHAVAAEDGSGSPGGVAVFQASPFTQNASQKGGPYDVGPYPASGTAVVDQYGWCDVIDTGSQIQVVFKGFSSDNTQRVTLTKTYVLSAPGSVTAVPATATATAAAPAIAAGITVQAVQATATAAAAAPAVTAGATVTGVRAQATATAPVPVVASAVVVAAVAATATAQTPAPTVGLGATIQAVRAQATASAAAPVVTAAVAVQAVVSTATATAIAPSVSTGAGTVVSPPAATATAAVPAPVVAAGSAVVAVSATAVASTPTSVTITAGGTVAGVRAQATAAAVAPVLTAMAVVQAVAATATAQAQAPTVTAGGAAVVQAVRAQATATAAAPVVTAGVAVQGLSATATALARVPVLSAGAVTYVPTAGAVATILAPFILGGDIRDVVIVAVPLPDRFKVVPLDDRYKTEPLAWRWQVEELS